MTLLPLLLLPHTTKLIPNIYPLLKTNHVLMVDLASQLLSTKSNRSLLSLLILSSKALFP